MFPCERVDVGFIDSVPFAGLRRFLPNVPSDTDARYSATQQR
jgi:hypothetical protein